MIPPGALVSVQVPEAGSPFNTTLPVSVAHVGCVMVPMVGAVGKALITSEAVFEVALFAPLQLVR